MACALLPTKEWGLHRGIAPDLWACYASGFLSPGELEEFSAMGYVLTTAVPVYGGTATYYEFKRRDGTTATDWSLGRHYGIPICCRLWFVTAWRLVVALRLHDLWFRVPGPIAPGRIACPLCFVRLLFKRKPV